MAGRPVSGPARSGRWFRDVRGRCQRPAEDFGCSAPFFGTEEGGEVFLRAADWNVGDSPCRHGIVSQVITSNPSDKANDRVAIDRVLL